MIVQVAIDLPNIETLDYSYNPENTNNFQKNSDYWSLGYCKSKKQKKCRFGYRRKKIFTCQTG